MADNGENIGGVNVAITGDYSPLVDAYSAAESISQTAGADIAAALTDGAMAAESAVVPLSDALAAVNTSATEAAAGMEQAGSAATTATPPVEGLASAAQAAGSATHEAGINVGELLQAGLELGGIAIGVETLKDLAAEALAVYANVQQATIAITALTGSATQANEIIEQLKNLATSDALSFPQLIAAEQKMIAIGIDLSAIPGALRAAADAAAATGGSFDSMTSAIDRLTLSGQLQARQLATMGLSLQDFAAVMGGSADQVKASFADMDPSERVKTIVDALGKYAGVAQQTADSISGQWQNLKTQAEFTFEEIGSVMAPIASGLMDIVSALGSAEQALIGGAIGAFQNLYGAIHDAIGVIGDFVSTLVDLKSAAGPAGDALSFIWGIVRDYNPFALAATAINTVADALHLITGTAPGLTTMLQALSDKTSQLVANSTNLSSANAALEATWQAAWSQVPHATDTLSLLNAALSDAKTKQDQLTDAYQKGTATAEQVISAQNAVADAQYRVADAQYQASLQTSTATQATKDFIVPLDGLTTAASDNANVIDSQQLSLQYLVDKLESAQTQLNITNQHYYAGATSLANLNAALKAFETAQNAVNKAVGEMPDPTPLFDTSKTAIQGMLHELDQFAPDVESIDPPVRNLADDIETILGKSISDVADATGPKMIAAFEDMQSQAGVTLDMVDEAWGKISSYVSKLAKTDLPGAISAQESYISLIEKTRASWGQVTDAQVAALNEDIKWAEQTGTSANAYVIQLANIKDKQKDIADSVTAWGTLYTDALGDIHKGFDTLGKDIADNIVDGKNWSERLARLSERR